ncbi:MAG: hypothetical protein GZ087_15715 [Flavobacterium sp.]|nr:hypothetical protein [Flavobacterium sp.]
MKINKKFVVVFSVCLLLYLVSDIFFNYAVFYLLGGLFGITSKWLGFGGFYFIWLFFLIITVLLFYKLKSKVFKIIIITLLWALLYLVDAILYEVMPDITSSLSSYFHIGLAILLKSLALSWIYNKGIKE